MALQMDATQKMTGNAGFDAFHAQVTKISTKSLPIYKKNACESEV
jgi:hypothetical protein